MKHLFICLGLILSSAFLYAEDIIITRTSEKIAVTIEEVGPDYVKYHTIANPNGPLFRLEASEIATIIYGNGEVQSFEQATSEIKTETETPAITQQTETNKDERIVQYGKDYYFMGRPIMLKDFLYLNCPTAYAYWKKSRQLTSAGWGVFGAGIACAITGTVLYACWNSGVRDIYPETGIAFWGIGGAACVITSIPLLSVGYHRMHNAYEIYNKDCTSAKNLTLNLQANQNGLGLALNF